MWKCGDEQQVSNILPDQHLVDPKWVVTKWTKYCTKKSELATKNIFF
jgi:CDP-glycerol glycerophosphotransferase (TagB/SpsB family)